MNIIIYYSGSSNPAIHIAISAGLGGYVAVSPSMVNLIQQNCPCKKSSALLKMFNLVYI